MKLAYHVSGREHWISAAGGFLAIFLLLWVGSAVTGTQGVLITTSMGASVILLFAAPHGAMSQPWPVFGGHFVSALIGVACTRWLPDDLLLAGSLAVALALAAMYSLRCLHPPGGATALYPVLGGAGVQALGWSYVLNPVMLSVAVLLIVATLFNFPFAWRRYPQAWFAVHAAPNRPAGETMIPHSQLVYALSQLDTFVDISEEDLQRIYALAMAAPTGLTPAETPQSGSAYPAQVSRSTESGY